MTSIKDVAEAAGVSTATVSRVLADKPHIRKEIRERVLAAVEKLNYRPNRVARSLRNRQSNTIGLVVADIRNPFFTSLSRAVEDVAYARDMSVFLCNSDENTRKETLYLDLLRDEHVAGIIIAPTAHTADTFSREVKLDLPVVVIDRRVSSGDVDSVVMDNVDGAFRLTSHLLDDGYRRIGAVFSIDISTGRERHEGFLKAHAVRGLEADPSLVCFTENREINGYEAAATLLGMDRPPDIIFATNGVMSTGVFRLLHERGIRIPEDIGLAGFDETPWFDLVSPAMTIFKQPTYEIGKTATELLLNRIAEPERPARDIVLKGKLVVRDSCRRPGSATH